MFATRLLVRVLPGALIIMTLVTPRGWAQQDPRTGHGEFVEDPPGRPWVAHRTPGCTVTVGGFASIQVNVDSQGRNIVGDAANEPSIAVDPTNPNHIVIGWRQFDTVDSNFRQAGYAYSSDGGATWTFPGVLDPGTFRSDPVLSADTTGAFYYYSLSTDPFHCSMFKSTDGGVNWTGPVYAFGGDKAWFAIDRTGGPGHGYLHAAWDYAGCCEPFRFNRSVDGGQSFEDPIELLGNPIWGTVNVGFDGKVYIGGIERRETDQFLLVRSSNAQNGDETTEFDLLTEVDMGGRLLFFAGNNPNPGGLMGQVWTLAGPPVDANHTRVYMLCTVDPADGDDPHELMFARSLDSGETFSAPRRLNDDPSDSGAWQWFGTMAVSPAGRIDVVFNDTRNSDDLRFSELFYTYSWNHGDDFSANQPVGPAFDSWLGWPNQDKLGDYYDMVADAGGAHVAYAATYNGEQDVYYLRLTVDCNDNGTHDADDILTGTSRDDDGDGRPDECDGIACDAIRRFRVICRDGRKLIAKVRSDLREGTRLIVDRNGEQKVMTINAQGKGKVRYRRPSGSHTVSIVECPTLRQTLDCGDP